MPVDFATWKGCV
jgi:hypothetical protein